MTAVRTKSCRKRVRQLELLSFSSSVFLTLLAHSSNSCPWTLLHVTTRDQKCKCPARHVSSRDLAAGRRNAPGLVVESVFDCQTSSSSHYSPAVSPTTHQGSKVRQFPIAHAHKTVYGDRTIKATGLAILSSIQFYRANSVFLGSIPEPHIS